MNAPTKDIEGAATILVVEDEAHLRGLVADALRSDGFKVVEIETVEEALAYLRAVDHVALVFADLRTPGKVDPKEFANTLQSEFPFVKVILTSGQEARDTVPPDMAFIPKPYILARVIAEIRARLAGHKTV